jgi:hypothetical protein
MSEKINLFNKIAIISIRIYQNNAKNKKHKCLHYPSCSNYSILAFQKYGFLKAFSLTIYRIRDCHPFSNRPYLDYP